MRPRVGRTEDGARAAGRPCPRAYLLAATTAAQWRWGIRGAEFFGDLRSDETVDNRKLFADWWRHWERRGDRLPILLPAAYATELIARETFDVGPTE